MKNFLLKIASLKDYDFQEKKYKKNIIKEINKIFKTTLEFYFKLKNR